jgi:hypothetical protein
MHHPRGSLPAIRWGRSCGGRFGLPSTLPPRAVIGAPHRPKCRLPESPCLAPSSRRLHRTSRWRRAGCLPPPELARCGQGVLYGCGPAQVGFGRWLSSFHGLTVSSKGKLSPEPLRLTRPERADPQRVTVGKGEVGGADHSLPVVAVGSVPHIYRREGLSPGDPA